MLGADAELRVPRHRTGALRERARTGTRLLDGSPLRLVAEESGGTAAPCDLAGDAERRWQIAASALDAADPDARAAVDDEYMIGDRWGVTHVEIARSYPCDDFVVSPALQAWRGVRIEAPAAAVWPWVAQVRLAPYSYDWIDNLGRSSPRELMGLSEPRIGEAFTTAGGRKVGEIVSVTPGQQLTGTIMGAFVSYVLVPEEHNTTRLLLKVVMQTTRWGAVALSVGDLLMARRQLLNFKQLAESHQRPSTAPE